MTRIGELLTPGGVFRLAAVVYHFAPGDPGERIERWIRETMAADVEAGWTRAELAEHVRTRTRRSRGFSNR